MLSFLRHATVTMKWEGERQNGRCSRKERTEGRHRQKCSITDYRNVGEKPKKTGVLLSGVSLASYE
jgi:hypothetical protein